MTTSPPTDLVIALYQGDLRDLIDLLQMSMGFDEPAGALHLLSIEQTRGTRYLVARQGEQIVGLVGVYIAPSEFANELEPPQIIDLAVRPELRRQGLARALVLQAEAEVLAAGQRRIWLYTDGNSTGLLTFYRRLGYRLAAVVPDYFGDGTVKAIFRKDLR